MKCPHCNDIILNINLEGTTINAPMGRQFNGVAYVCPLCNAILSTAIDPIAIKTDTIEAITGRPL